MPTKDAVKPPPRGGKRAQSPPGHQISEFVTEDLARELFEQRQWAKELDPAQLLGGATEVRLLRQALRDAFVTGDPSVRQHAEALRRLLRERAVVPEIEDDPDGEGGLEDGLSADLRRVLQRVGLEMGVDA